MARCGEKRTKAVEFPEAKPVFLTSVQDSGFITKKVGDPYQAGKGLTDTANAFWPHYEPTDTIGKFFKTGSGGYMISSVAFRDSLEQKHLVFEIDLRGNILKQARFGLGNYPSCLNGDFFTGFRKVGSHFF